ncbi:general stress protein [Staphylococcus sp. 17KM0847]|uniref:general stress protein n=1 Tax=Staphylococcus sp. 17KM0847 TaxID=2583989 RepID=UPI0015DE7D9D|nr:general stress protein [Staphylococcus sp. 17KM0847]
MTQFNLVKTEADAIKAVDALLNDGYKEHEITIISKDKFETNRFNNSEVKHKSTTGTVSDKFMRFFIGEDPEEAAFTRFDLADSDKAHLKEAVANGEIAILVNTLTQPQTEVSETNSAYQQQEFKHHPSEHKGDIE